MSTNNLDDTHPVVWLILELLGASAVVASFVFEYIRSQTYGNPRYGVLIGVALVFGAVVFVRRSKMNRKKKSIDL